MLSENERAALGHLLTADFRGVEQLRVQAEHVLVNDRCTCGCPTIGFVVDQHDVPGPTPHVGTAKAPAGQGEVLVVEADRRGADPPQYVLLFVSRDGWLSRLELVSFVDDPPALFPSPAELGPPVVRRH